MRLIDADAIYKQVQEAEDLARDRVIDTKETLLFKSNINPAYTRYLAMVGERTWMKHMIANAPTVDAVPVVRCRECKHNSYCCRSINPYGECDNDYCSYGERKDGDADGV